MTANLRSVDQVVHLASVDSNNDDYRLTVCEERGIDKHGDIQIMALYESEDLALTRAVVTCVTCLGMTARRKL